MPRHRKTPPSAPILVVHGVTVEEWTRRYGVEPFMHPCQGCGAPLTTTIPFVRGSLRGLTAPACECRGNVLEDGLCTPYALVRDPKVGDLFSGDGRLDR